MQIDIIETPGLGDRSYLVTDGGVGVVIDPQRDIDRVLDLAADRGVAITHVLETHMHNDYVTGGLELARTRRRRVRACRPATTSPTSARRVRDGDVLDAGPMRVAGAAHPRAHPPPRQLRARRRRRRGAGGVFTGGSMLYGATGRTDLLGAEHTEDAHPRPVPLGAPAGRRAARRHPGLPHPRLRQLLLGHPDQRRRLHHRRADAGPTRR